jgi:hypothetical protein
MKKFKFIILSLIILIILLLLLKLMIKTNTKDYGIHPKIIWTYWDNPNKIPKTVKICMDSWKKYNPNYKIIFLTKTNYINYINIPENIALHKNFNDNPARFSDLIRLYALSEHGGIWIDSSILLKKSLDTWLFPSPAEFSGFYLEAFTKNNLPPVIESWFLASNKNSKFIELWRDEFCKMIEYPNVEKYIESRKEMGVDYEKISIPDYLAIHIAAQKILQINKYPLSQLILKKAEDGPFKYLTQSNWDSEKALRLACNNNKYQSPIMKMRSHERNALEKYIESDLSIEKCNWLN